ncbi:uncharacterized protein TNCV_2169811 [Trichonephila clavipes]|nr:uncharacterized protein TNCV_2169811 [Trichonephila clavipes]
MHKCVFFLTLLCAVLHQFVEANEKCKEQFKKLRQAFQEVTEEENAPDCFKQLGLDKFRGTDNEEDEEEDKRQHKELIKYLKSLPEQDENRAKECMQQVGKMAFERVGHEMTEECMEVLKAKGRKIEAEAS